MTQLELTRPEDDYGDTQHCEACGFDPIPGVLCTDPKCDLLIASEALERATEIVTGIETQLANARMDERAAQTRVNNASQRVEDAERAARRARFQPKPETVAQYGSRPDLLARWGWSGVNLHVGTCIHGQKTRGIHWHHRGERKGWICASLKYVAAKDGSPTLDMVEAYALLLHSPDYAKVAETIEAEGRVVARWIKDKIK